MVLDTFVFTITLPRDASLLPLLKEVSGQMSMYLGLPEDEARQARDVLERLVAERLKHAGNGAGPISVRFERPHTAATVSVEVRSSAASDDPAGTGERAVPAAGDNGQTPIRLSWRLRDDG